MSILPPVGGDGEALRDAALALLRVRRADLIRACTAAALRVAIDRGEVCADDVRFRSAEPRQLALNIDRVGDAD